MYLLFILCALILFGLFSWVAIRRNNRRWLPWRLALGAIAVAALYCIAFPPQRTVNVNPAEAILLTEGYSEDSLGTLTEKLSSARPILLAYQVNAEEATPVVNMTALKQEYPQVRKLHVLGHGLEKGDLKELQGLDIEPHLSPQPYGITFLHWPQRVTLGETINITGTFNHNSNEQVWLGFEVAGVLVDSVSIAEQGEQLFSLSYTPKAAGRFVYVLEVKKGEDAFREELAVEVNVPQSLQVLMLAAFPTPEIRFLKTALAEQQHGVALRTAISKNKYYSEWLNMPRAEFSRLTSSVLSRFDLVIVDVATLQELSRAERTALEEVIQKEGLGLLLLPDELPLKHTPLYKDFNFTRVSRTATHTTRLSWQGLENASPEVEVLPFAIQDKSTVFPLVSDESRSWFVAGKRSGWGHIALTALPNTFQWALSGREELYHQYWAHLLNRIARKKAVAQQGQITSGISVVNQAVEVRLADYSGSSQSLQAMVVQEGSNKAAALALAQDAQLAYQFEGTYWPKQKGWHQVLAAEDTTHFYVVGNDAWKSIKQMEKQSSTLLYAATMQEKTDLSTETIAISKPWNPLYFYLIFIAAVGFLWLEEKL